MAHTVSTRCATEPDAAASSRSAPVVEKSWRTLANTPTAALGRYVTPLRSKVNPLVYPWLCSWIEVRSAAVGSSSRSPETVRTPDVASNTTARGTWDTLE